MERSLKRLAAGAACGLLFAAALNAQWRPFGSGGRYEPDGRYGRYAPGDGIVNRTLNDVDRAWSHAYAGHHERKHFEEARKNLFRFQDRWARGDFDRGRLDKAIENVQRIVDSRGVRPDDRQILARDLMALRDFRSHREYGREWPRY